jgi:hypothetical protein
VAIVNGREGLLAEVAQSPIELRSYLATEFSHLLLQESFLEALSGQLPPDAASQQRLPVVLERLRQLAAGLPEKLPQLH